MKLPFSSLAVLLALAPAAPLRAAEPTNAAEAAVKKAAEDQRIDGLYQSKVATLSPARHAWEKVLQENLGNGFYLPNHKRDFVKGTSTAWDFVADDPQLPRILLIGDSVSRAYTLGVRKILASRANVHRAPENCGPTANGLKKIETWLASAGPEKWDIIYFNFGIHDRGTPVADYTARLAQIITRLKQTGATVIWASTTPIPDDPSKNQTAASIIERNTAAAALAQQHALHVDDLFTFITPHLAATQRPNDVHFTDRGYELLAAQVAATLSVALPTK
jgi:lysophospholipase L1-like esterase